MDLSERALELLGRRGAIVHRGQLHEIAFLDDSFDLVALFEVLEHVDDDAGLLQGLARITRPDGRLVLSVPLGMRNYTKWDRFSGHIRRYEPDELLQKLARAGFELECFEARPGTVGPAQRLAAPVQVALVRLFPRFSLWVNEHILQPAIRKMQLDWRGAADWGERTRDAFGCTVVCRRAR